MYTYAICGSIKYRYIKKIYYNNIVMNETEKENIDSLKM